MDWPDGALMEPLRGLCSGVGGWLFWVLNLQREGPDPIFYILYGTWQQTNVVSPTPSLPLSPPLCIHVCIRVPSVNVQLLRLFLGKHRSDLWPR